MFYFFCNRWLERCKIDLWNNENWADHQEFPVLKSLWWCAHLLALSRYWLHLDVSLLSREFFENIFYPFYLLFSDIYLKSPLPKGWRLFLRIPNVFLTSWRFMYNIESDIQMNFDFLSPVIDELVGKFDNFQKTNSIITATILFLCLYRFSLK
jgi:hypothetical protein